MTTKTVLCRHCFQEIPLSGEREALLSVDRASGVLQVAENAISAPTNKALLKKLNYDYRRAMKVVDAAFEIVGGYSGRSSMDALREALRDAGRTI